jgi:PAT family beta-lactamase induction signal transducer AmpG
VTRKRAPFPSPVPCVRHNPRTMLGVFRNRKMAAILLLGFASGFPLFLPTRALQTWLTIAGIDLTTIGFLSLVSLPYSLKFLWAPLLDRYSLPGIGRRKGWLLLTQFLLVFAIGAIAFQDPKTTLQWIAINAVVIAILGATQDIVIDAYRVDALKPSEATASAAAIVVGYRAALIVTGSVAFLIADRTSWPTAYLFLAACMILVIAVTTRLSEPSPNIRPPETIREAVLVPFAEFRSRLGGNRALLALLFVILFRLGDGLLLNMTNPFLIQAGFTLREVGIVQGGIGLIAMILGTLAAGAIASRVGMYRALWICGSLQAASNLAYLALSQAGNNFAVMTGTIIVENFCGGLGTAALVGFLTTLCNPRFSATQYALLSSIVAVGRDLLASPAGKLAETMGWSGFFFLSFVAGLPALALLPLFAKKPGRQDMMTS